MPPKREVTSPEGEGSAVGKSNTPIPVPVRQNTPAASGKEVETTQDNDDDKEEKEMVLRESVKVKLPDTFNGKREDLEAFLLQVGLYSHFNRDKFEDDEDKIMWTVSYLRGEALKWVQPMVRDYMDKNHSSEMLPMTRVVMMI